MRTTISKDKSEAQEKFSHPTTKPLQNVNVVQKKEKGDKDKTKNIPSQINIQNFSVLSKFKTLGELFI